MGKHRDIARELRGWIVENHDVSAGVYKMQLADAADYITALEDLIAIQAMASWQPIETAPKDGRNIDLWVVDSNGAGERAPDCYWLADEWAETPHWRQRYAECGPTGSSTRLDCTPTHWMPRPNPPAVDNPV